MLLTIRHKIYTRPYEPRSIPWASHEVRMSTSAFQYYYKKTFGITFMQDLICARMEFAKNLLVTTNLSVREISRQCGYRNYEHFARQFKAQCGIAPGAFRSGK